MRCVIYLRVSTDQQAARDDTEEGFSLPAQREACLQLAREQGWSVIDEYVDHDSGSKNSAHRPRFKAMLDRIFEQGDIDAVVVHKVDRFARDAAHHFAVRAALRRKNISLISVTERFEDNASGRLVEGIHALMAEFYSANLAAEVKKGMRQKVRIGGWTHRAPLGYINRKESIEGRRIAYVEPDPDRAPLIKLAFDMYATGEHTIEHVLDEVTMRGLTTRPWRNRPAQPLSVNGLTWVLNNKFYTGIVDWKGAEYPGRHTPIVDMKTFLKVQEFFAARTGRESRESRHRHYLKGCLICGVCGRRLSLQKSKGQYLYFFCLGQKDRRKPTGCQEKYVNAVDLERQVEELYKRIQITPAAASELRAMLEAELIAQQDRNAVDRDLQTKRLTTLESQRRKLLEAYYAGAIEVSTLREEQERIGCETRQAEELLKSADKDLAEWQSVLDLAMQLATNCANAYRMADSKVKRQFNQAVFEQIIVRNGLIAEAKYHSPFELVFTKKFEHGPYRRDG